MLLTILAIVLIIYGTFKILYGIYDNLLTKAQREKNRENKWLKYVTPPDHTISSKMVSISLFFFGIYTLIHGLDILNVFSSETHEWLESYLLGRVPLFIQFSIYSIVITGFYALVLYTNLPIPKDPENTFFYIVGGLCLGLSFVVSLPLMILYFLMVDHGWQMFELYPWLCILNIVSCIIYTALMFYLIVMAFLAKLEKENKKIKDMTPFEIYTLVSTLLMIPVNIFS
jgi:hypothetical protein